MGGGGRGRGGRNRDRLSQHENRLNRVVVQRWYFVFTGLKSIYGKELGWDGRGGYAVSEEGVLMAGSL